MSPPCLSRGVLVAFEGIDGTGKSTQVERLTAIFRALGYDVLARREPTDSPWGRRLREAMHVRRRLLSPAQELDLFLLDRRYDVAAHIRPALAAGKLVLLDRYYFSTMAYQGARGLDPEEIRRQNEAFAPVPDLVVVLLLDPAQALARIRQARGHTDEVFEREGYLRRVEEGFRSLQAPYIYPLAADRPIDVVTAAVQRKIQKILDIFSLTPPSPALGMR
ncbi:MAG TPA: dTMP kinase [Alphaproteobacteria bacterium]|nr:dTMP kinase [Alphaproteobacteria bacterium]